MQGIGEEEHQSESKTLEEQSARADTLNKKRNLEHDIKAGISVLKKKLKQAAVFIKENNLEPVEAELKSHVSIEESEPLCQTKRRVSLQRVNKQNACGRQVDEN